VKIAVCVKRVPDSEARIKPGPDGRTIDDTGVKYGINPYDEYAVEEALQIRDRDGGEVVAVSLGPAACGEVLRHVLAMGADRAVLLEVERQPIDPLVVARALTDELRDGGYDLLLFGKQAIDDELEAVGPMVASLLGLPCVSAIVKLALSDGKGRAEREFEDGTEIVELALPAVLTAEKGLNEPRRPALKGIMQARKKPLEAKAVTLDDCALEIVETVNPPPRAEGRILGEGPEAIPALVEALRVEAKVL
jgi:electron transfer flavoprotein beta subunit